ncbi:F0F1 ATP synthase subunit gamma [Methyloterricola oryzae]|uniref:F0F1 ATP synthase subunit gamma n=1 Tax=Methyloterricola oryzae TaxID=1495050 RepID=UPI0005EB1BAD|nr:F0F1 ATP synthase subunit gamma [Methyloterricola oryzae]
MSRRRELDQHRRQLDEIAEIMRSMKNLAYMETRKLSRLLDAQGEALALIEAAASDFLTFYPDLARLPVGGQRLVLLIGSERGFCGDFNEALLKAAAGELAGAHLIAVGSRITARLAENAAGATLLQGAGVAEEIGAALLSLSAAIARFQAHELALSLVVWHHRNGREDPVRSTLLPPFADREPNRPQGHAPLLYLRPDRFYADLVEHYLMAVLHEIFYTSLMAENQRRIQHLEGAIRRLDDRSAEFARQSRVLRQEEITEEIEVILLSAEAGSLRPGSP